MPFFCLDRNAPKRSRLTMRQPIFAVATLLLLHACAGATQAPESPDTETSDTQANPSSASDPSNDVDSAQASEQATETGAETDDDDAPSPRETLVREGTAFILNFEKSDIGIDEKEKCAKRGGGDIAKEANCFATAMNKYPREGILFEKSGDDWTYVRFGLIKNARQDFNKVKVDIAEPTGNKIVLTPTGADTASRRKGTVPKKLEFTVVDEYTVELADPSRGKLIYEPKLGLFAAE